MGERILKYNKNALQKRPASADCGVQSVEPNTNYLEPRRDPKKGLNNHVYKRKKEERRGEEKRRIR